VSERQFPIIQPDRNRADDFPRSVPWDFVAPHEAQAMANHDETLQRLSERGGLSVEELYCTVNGQSLFPLKNMPSQEVALAWLRRTLGEREVKGGESS